MKFAGMAKKRYIVVALVLVFSLMGIHAVQGADSVVDIIFASQDYVDLRIAELGGKLDGLDKKLAEQNKIIEEQGKTIEELKKKIESLPAQSAGGSSRQAATFEKVEVKAGKRVLAGAGAEMIVRSGKVTCIASTSGGVADLTEGRDVGTSGVAVLNHLLMFPAEDGRGLKVNDDAWIMIKGKYTIE